MRTAHKYIEIVRHRGQKGLELKRVYRNLLNRDLFILAYANLYANKGAMTQGVDSNDTVDGMSIKRIDKIIKRLRNRKYYWKPARRIGIPKRNSNKRRPLGIPGWNDKLVEEVLRIVLSAYYEPQFSRYSHGFRPYLSCLSALQEIARWAGTKWFIEGDIKGCFDNIVHEILLDIIGKRIKDRSLRRLLKGMLKAGYLQDWKYHVSYSGTPQGGVLSPLLSNIILSELDQYIEEELIPQYTKGDSRKRNPIYNRLNVAMTYAKQKGNIKRYRELRKIKRQLPSQLLNDPNFRRLRFVRYADDFLLGFIGPRSEAMEIKRKLSQFLGGLKLTLSEDKTLITHAGKERARFLGYEIYIAQDNNRLTKNRKQSNYNGRAINGRPIFNVPQDVINEWSHHFSKGDRTYHRPYLLGCSDFEIILTYGMEFQGLANYYSFAHNVSKLYKVKHHYMTSLAKTLAAKYRKNVRWVYRKYKRKSIYGVTCLIKRIQHPDKPKKIFQAKFGDKPLRRNGTAIIVDNRAQFYRNGNELIKRLLTNKCELCGSEEDVQGHHVRKLKDIKKKYRGKATPPAWALFMMKRNRKVIFVCRQCHTNIHYGRYDGSKVELRLTGEPDDTETVKSGSEGACWKSVPISSG